MPMQQENRSGKDRREHHVKFPYEAERRITEERRRVKMAVQRGPL